MILKSVCSLISDILCIYTIIGNLYSRNNNNNDLFFFKVDIIEKCNLFFFS